MTAPAGRAALAGALADHLGPGSVQALDQILRQLHREGWQITPQPPRPVPDTPRRRRPRPGEPPR